VTYIPPRKGVSHMDGQIQLLCEGPKGDYQWVRETKPRKFWWCLVSSTLSQRPETPPRGLARPDDDIDGADEVGVPLVLVVQGLQGRAAKFVRAAE